MIKKVEKWYPGEGKLTTGHAVLYVILVLGLISAVIRLFFGLGATTNLNDAYPWGCGSALTCSPGWPWLRAASPWPRPSISST